MAERSVLTISVHPDTSNCGIPEASGSPHRHYLRNVAGGRELLPQYPRQLQDGCFR